ncbi:MAG: DNA topoisomerase VI subunit B [Candidatus Hodarchaeales archaeon]|jgi:DNA topoisomerase-6 subunit B
MTKAAKTSKKQKMTKEKIVRRSAADFFQDNKAIAGFDNTMRVVFTSVRELVENGLDAAERVGNMPEIHVKIQRLQKEEIARLLNISSFDSSEKLDFLRLTVRDNGSGVQSEFVPPLFGRVLTGSNYGSRQSRGRFGLGAKMVLLNAMSSVDLPLIVKSKYLNEDFTSYHELMINLAENEPIILTQREIPQETAEAIKNSGTEVSVTFTGSWNLASRWVREYFSQLSMITPYASFYVQYPDSDEPLEMVRVVEEMPPYPQIAKVHPWGTDITQFKRELAVTQSPSMEIFLQDHFQGVGPKTAKDFLDFIKIDYNKTPNNLSASDIRRIVHEGFVMPDHDPKKRREQKYFPFRRPSGDSLAPLGWDLLAKGIEKELSPQFVRATAGDISAYSGHPFIVEAALAYGGPMLSGETGNPKIYRFANRIPLLFGVGSDIISKCVQKMNWKTYKIKINKSPIAIVVSIVSSKIPFPETSKEYIADVDELRKEVMRVLKKLARGLSQHLGRAERERREKQRQSRFETAAPKVLRNLAKILEVEETPFLLQSSEEFSKLEKALASAVPRLVRRTYPPSPLISSIGEWLPMETYIALVEHNIQTIYQFLRAPLTELSDIAGLTEEKIAEIKRATVNSQERSKNAPSMREFELFSRLIEDDFSKYHKALRIHKALNKRWIVSSLDFFTTTISQLRLVENFPEKLLYEVKQRAIIGHLTNHPKMPYSLKTLPWITEDLEKDLKSAKIHNILDYLIAFPEKLSQIPDLSFRLIEEAKKEIQKGIKQGYIDPEKVIGAATFDWMDYRVTPRLRGRNISKIKEFLKAPNEKLVEISDLTENLILRSKRVQNEEIKQLNEEKPFLLVDALQETMIPDLDRLEIKGFVDFLQAKEKDLLIIRGLVNHLISMKLDEVLEKIEQDHEIFPTKAAWWLDSELEVQLQDLGIQTVYDFIRYPSSKLLKLDKLDVQILETIKRTYGTPIPLLTPDERKNLESQHILCLEELQASLSTLKLKPKTFQSRIEEILNSLNNPICYLPIPNKYYQTLHNLGVSKIIDFLVWPDTDLHRKTGISYKLIERAKSKISPEEIKTLIDSKSISISVLAKNLDGKSWQKLLQSDLTLQELYYNLPYKTDMIEQLKLKNREIDQLNELFLTPISRIPQIKPIQVAKLRSNKITSFIDLMSWSRGDIAEIIGREEKFVDNLLSDFDQFLPGMPLIDLGVLSATEMKSLKSKGFPTVENVYFCAKKETFGVMGVKWKKIERYQRILETPVAMLQLRSSSDKKTIHISHEGLERLAYNGIDQIIKLVYWSPDELKSILKMSLKRVEELKQSVAIKEHGMPLETVCGYNRKTISTLLGYGIETVEDLYFTASEDMLDEEDELDWSYVKKAMEALELPITFLSGVIAAKYIDKLGKKRIDTIIRFLITSEEELSEILETPSENVENLRKKVNLVQLRESTETSVSILEGFPRKQLQILADEQISTIFDFLTTPDDQIASLLEFDLKQVVTMKKDLNFTNIKSIKEEKMIPLAKVSIFDKKIIRKLARLGVESLADLYYVATPKTFVDSDIEWQVILDAKTILDMPIEISPVPTKEEIKILRKAKIKTVLDLMMESLDKLESRTKLPAAKVKALQGSINVNEIITLLKQLLIDKIDFPSEYLSSLRRAEIKTIFELLTNPNEEIYLVKEGEKKLRIDSERWTKLFSVLAVPLSLVLGSDREIIKKLKQKRIETLKDVYSTSSERIETILETDPSGFLAELKALSFIEIAQFLYIPICFIPNLTLDWMHTLNKNSITRVGDLFDKSIKNLAEQIGTSSPKTRVLVTGITMPEVIKCLEEEMISLNNFSNILSTKVISELENRNITSIQEFILHDKKEFDFAELDKIYEVLDAPINRLSEELPLDDLRKLSQNGVSSISDWFFTSNSSLAKIIEMDASEITNMKKRYDFQAAGEITEVDTPLQSFTESGYIDFEEVEKCGIRVLEDLLFVDLETISVSDQLKSQLDNLKDALNSSLAYYASLPPQYVVPLALNGVTSITQMIKTNFSDLEDPMDIITEEDYNTAKNSINLVDIITHKKTDSEFRVKLSSLQAFSPKQLEDIKKLGFDNVVDLYFRLDTERLTKSLVKPVETVKRVLEKPIAILPSVRNNFPQKIPLLYNAGITSTIQFLFWPKDDLAELLEVKRYEISKYRKINLGALKRKKNLGTPIDNFVRIPEEHIASLREMSIDNIEDLYFHLKRYNFVPDEVVPSKLIKECIRDLENPIVRLAGLPIPVAQELVKKGITRIIDFLYWPEDDLKKIYGLSAAKNRQIKSNIRLRRKADVVGRLDSYMTKK